MEGGREGVLLCQRPSFKREEGLSMILVALHIGQWSTAFYPWPLPSEEHRCLHTLCPVLALLFIWMGPSYLCHGQNRTRESLCPNSIFPCLPWLLARVSRFTLAFVHVPPGVWLLFKCLFKFLFKRGVRLLAGPRPTHLLDFKGWMLPTHSTHSVLGWALLRSQFLSCEVPLNTVIFLTGMSGNPGVGIFPIPRQETNETRT